MNELKNNLSLKDLNLHEQNDSFSIFSDKIYDDVRPSMTFLSSGEEKNFFKEQTELLNTKRKRASEKKDKKPHTKYTYDNLKRKCKHLVIENVRNLLMKKLKKNIMEILAKEYLKKNWLN